MVNSVIIDSMARPRAASAKRKRQRLELGSGVAAESLIQLSIQNTGSLRVSTVGQVEGSVAYP